MTTKTPCAVCLEKGTSYPMTEAELRIHFDANPDHKTYATYVHTGHIAPVVSKVPRFSQWHENPSGGDPIPFYWFDGKEYDANEIIFRGLELPETPPCDL